MVLHRYNQRGEETTACLCHNYIQWCSILYGALGEDPPPSKTLFRLVLYHF